MKTLLAILVLLAVSGCMTEREQMIHDFANNLFEGDAPIYFLPEGTMVISRHETRMILMLTPDSKTIEVEALLMPAGGLMVPNKMAAEVAREVFSKEMQT